jgi:hypothetical protein
VSAVDVKALIESHPRHTTVGDEYVSVLHSELSALTHAVVIAVEALREIKVAEHTHSARTQAFDALAAIEKEVTL